MECKPQGKGMSFEKKKALDGVKYSCVKEEVGLCSQLTLSGSCFGLELMMTFLSIYGILSLQYLDVPVSLVSVHGLVCSAISLVVIPLIGKLTDQGGNVRVRKAISLMIGLGFILAAFTFIFVSCVIKIKSDAVNITLDGNPCGSRHDCTNLNFQLQFNNSQAHNQDISRTVYPQPAASSSIAYLSGSIGNSNDIDSSHQFKKRSSNEEATMSQNKQSAVYNKTSTFTNKNNASNQENYPGSNTSLSSIPVTAVLAILGLAFLDMGFDVSMAPTRAFILESVPTWQHSSVLATATVTSSFAGVCLAAMGLFEIPLRLASVIANADQMAVALMCLCVFIGLVNIISFGVSLLTGFKFINTKDDIKPRPKDINQTSEIKNYKTTCSCLPMCSDEAQNTSKYADILTDEDYSHEDIEGGAITVGSPHTSVSTLSSKTSTRPQFTRSHSERSFAQLFNKRLVILLIASFFSYGAMIGFITFASNSLTIEVYKGDPQARPDTEARQNYQDGLRMSSVGVLVYYVLYFVVSSFSKKILDLAGPRMFFIASNSLMALTCLLFTLTGHLVAYFAAMLACSVHKCMSYTVPFLLATIYSQQETENEDGGEPVDRSRKLGRVTSLVGFLLPAQNLVMSSTMGPLMAVMGSSWPPMYYVTVASFLAAVVMAGIYFCKTVKS